MAITPLFFGLLVLLWLSLGAAGWLIATLLCRRASLRALTAALIGAVLGGVLPALLGARALAGLLTGMGLAVAGSLAAAWQTAAWLARREQTDGEALRSRTREQEV